ncbi:MAG: ATP-binding protein [Candidatus Omnitrophota bacterium]
MKNPFIFGDVVKGEYFTNREEEIKELTLDLLSGQNILLFSPRRYGKTSLILKVLDNLKKEDVIPVYVDLFRITSVHTFVKIYTAAITKASATKLEEAVQFLKTNFPTIVPKVVVKTSEPTEFEFDFEAAKKDMDKVLDDLYDLPQKIATKRKRQVAIVFDEFQEIAELKMPIERSLRAKIQHHDKVAYCFMGSKRHLLDELFLDKNKPLYRIAKSAPLGKIPAEKFKTFIHSRFKSVDMGIEKGLIEQILKLTACHPYYTQQICHEIFNICFSKKELPTITPKDIEQSLDKCISAQSYAYSTIWDGLAGKQKDLILALALNPEASIYSQEFLTEHELGAPATVQTAVKALEKKGLLDRQNGSYSISDIFFVEWIKKKIA